LRHNPHNSNALGQFCQSCVCPGLLLDKNLVKISKCLLGEYLRLINLGSEQLFVCRPLAISQNWELKINGGSRGRACTAYSGHSRCSIANGFQHTGCKK
jgi:hypothetical protein